MDILRQLLSSKKGVALLVGIALVVLTPWLRRLGIEVSEDEKQQIIALVMAYLVGQGLADVGKHRLVDVTLPVEPWPSSSPPPATTTSGTIG